MISKKHSLLFGTPPCSRMYIVLQLHCICFYYFLWIGPENTHNPNHRSFYCTNHPFRSTQKNNFPDCTPSTEPSHYITESRKTAKIPLTLFYNF